MRKAALKGVHRVRVKGREYCYAWRGGPRLKATYGSPAFVAELHAAQASRHAPDSSRVAGLVTLYLTSPAWEEGTRERTKKLWRPHLDRVRAHFGSLSVKQFDRPEIRPEIVRWRNLRRATPRAADTGVQALSRLMTFAVDEGLIRTNPCFGIKALYDGDRSEIIWLPEELAKLEAVASPEVMWATRLAVLTGLRQDDCRGMLWSEVGELAIETETNKSERARSQKPKKIALIPMYGELRELLESIPRRSENVLTNTYGEAWRSGLSDSFADAAKRAGVDKHFNDLRGTAATRLYQAEFPLREIAEIMGWEESSVEKIIKRYVRRDALLRDRIRRLDENTARMESVKPGVKTGS